MKKPLRIISLSFSGTTPPDHSTKESPLQQLLADITFTFASHDADVLYFTSGGSEQFALEHLRPGRLNILLASRQDNAFASAMEVMAYARAEEIPARLFSLDESRDLEELRTTLATMVGLKELQGMRAGLIGDASPWLVASVIPGTLLRDRLGIELVRVAWQELSDYRTQEADKSFVEKFGAERFPGLDDASRIYRVLSKAVEEHRLDALAVECFPLVQQHQVTACLSLSDMNDRGVVAACEGDLASMTGMILVKAVTGRIPWMANVASIEGDRLLLAHCTAPTGLLADFTVGTHFETGKGTAVAGRFDANKVTLFRLDNRLEKIFLARGRVVARPAHAFACRTQIEVELPEGDIASLKGTPLGNHHLVLPGDFTERLGILSALLQLKIVNSDGASDSRLENG